MTEAADKESACLVPAGTGQALAQPVSTSRAVTMATAFQGLIPTSIGEAFALAGYLARSTAIPKPYRGKPETVLTIMLAGMEVGLTPIRAVNNLTNISGNLGMKADLQLALVRRSGLLDFYDEGFELRGQTDTDLAGRTVEGAKILALVKAVPQGKPYGWATARRKGDAQYVTRTFTWSDAETAEIWELDEDGNGKRKSKLSEKFNYVSFPADMYPKRARARALQVTHSDVLAGMLSVEALEGGQIPAEPDGGDVEDLLAGLGEDRKAVEAGFDALELSRARRVQKLMEYQGRPGDLVTWLRDEYGQRTGRGKAGTAKNAKAAGPIIEGHVVESPATGPAGPSEGDPAAGRVQVSPPAPTGPDGPGEENNPTLIDNDLREAMPTVVPEPAKPEEPKASSPAAKAAAKFRERFGRGGPTF